MSDVVASKISASPPTNGVPLPSAPTFSMMAALSASSDTSLPPPLPSLSSSAPSMSAPEPTPLPPPSPPPLPVPLSIAPTPTPTPPLSSFPTQQPQPAPPPPRPVDPRAAFNDYASANEISEYDADNLYGILSVASVGFLIDDSASMRKPIVPEGANAFALAAAAAASGVPQPTRWSEACRATQQIAELAGALKSGEGVDLHFMNRAGPAGKVRTGGEINRYFLEQPAPGSGTPMLRAIRTICASNEVRRARRYLLIVITDGEPNDGSPMSESIVQLRDLLSRTPSQMYTTMVECTDNKESMDYLEGWNGQVPRFDNTEAYAEEVLRIRNIQQNPLYRFTYTDYVVKILMGAFRDLLGPQAAAKYCSIDMVRINQSQQQSASQYRQQQPQQQQPAWRPLPEQKTASDNFSSAAAPSQQPQQQQQQYDPRWSTPTQTSTSPPPPTASQYDPLRASQYAAGPSPSPVVGRPGCCVIL